MFPRTGSLWPLILLHAVHDYAYLAPGTAGPFVTMPVDTGLHMAFSATYALCGVEIRSRGELAAVFGAASAAGKGGAEISAGRA